MVDTRDLKSLDPKGLYGFDSRPRHITNDSSMKSDFCIYNKWERRIVLSGTYQTCMEYFNKQDKGFRKSHKIVNKNELKIK